MNTTARRLTPLTLIAATLAAAFLVQGPQAALPVVPLEPVHMTAQRVSAGRAAVVPLPLVEVSARRVDAHGLRVVQLPVVDVSARRSSNATGWLAQQRPAVAGTRKPV